MKRTLLFSILALTLFLVGCIKTEVETKTIILSDQLLTNDHVIADTIVYSVDIVNVIPEDDWENWKLRHMNRTKLVEEVFQKVYSGQLKAYDYFTEELLTVDEIRRIEQEEDYSRENIEELQFEEIWLFSAEQKLFHKEVLSMVLAYGTYSDNGNRLGLKPVFRVMLRPDHEK